MYDITFVPKSEIMFPNESLPIISFLDVFSMQKRSIIPENNASFFSVTMIIFQNATMDLGLIWGISDTFNGFMTVPNLIAVFLLTPVVLKLIRQHFEK